MLAPASARGNFRRWEEKIKILFSDMPFSSRTRKEVEMYENNAAPEKKMRPFVLRAAFSVESRPDADTVLSYGVCSLSVLLIQLRTGFWRLRP